MRNTNLCAESVISRSCRLPARASDKHDGRKLATEVATADVAIEYEALVNILLAIAEKEDGKPDQWVRNAMMLITCCYIPDCVEFAVLKSSHGSCNLVRNNNAR